MSNYNKSLAKRVLKLRYETKNSIDILGKKFNPKAQHEMGREIQIDYRGLKYLQEQKAKEKARRRDKMF
jgi:hypothetical protein